LFKIFLIAFIVFITIMILFIILIVNRRHTIQTFSIQTFLGNSSYNLFDKEPIEQKKSLIETINDYFNDKDDEIIDDGDGDIGDGGDDAGE